MDEQNTGDAWTTPDGDAQTTPAEDRAPAEDAAPAGRSRGKKLLIWAAVTPLALALLAAVGIGGYYLWSQTQWSVVEREGGIAVRHGTGPFVSYAQAGTDVDLDLLPLGARKTLGATIAVDGREGAAATISGLRATAQRCRDTLEPPCPARALHAPVIQVEPDHFPHGNRVSVSWSELDERGGVKVSILVNGKSPTGSCPAQLSGEGDCVFTGTFGTQYTVTATTSGPEGTEDVVTDTTASTFAKPSVSVRKGSKEFKGRTTDTRAKGSFCKVIVTVAGLAPAKEYGVKITTSGHAPAKSKFVTDGDGNFSGWVYSYGDPNRGSWLRVTTAGMTSKKVPWQCGGLG